MSEDSEELQRRVDRGAALWHRWCETGDIDVLRECLEASRHALELSPSNPFVRQNVVHVLVQLYRGTGDAAVLDEALDHVIDLIPEHEDDGDPTLVTLAQEVIALAEGRPRHAEARLKFVAAYAELSRRAGELLVSMAVEDRDPDGLQEGIDLLDEALSAPTDDPAARSKRLHARAWAAGVRWQMLREPADLDFAIEGLKVAQSLAGQDVPAELLGNLALSLLHRYRRDGDFTDLSAAADVLAGSGDVHHREMLQEIYFERYEATADITDLDTAIELTRRLIDDKPADEELRTNLRNMLAVRLVYREDADVAAEVARLSAEIVDEVPHALTTILDWTRTWEDDPATDPVPPSGPARRVLFLRTFKDPAADVVVLRHLAAALGPQDVIVLLSDARDEAQLAAAAGDRVELVTTTDSDWTRVVHREMAAADAIVLHLSPKDLALPRVSRPPDLSADFPRELWEIGPDAGPEHRAAAEVAIAEFTSKRVAAFDATPLGGIPTGAGLLRELAYLDRLGCLERTVVVLDNLHLFSFSQRVVNAVMSLGDVTTVDGRYANARLTALERQLGLLHAHRNGITFSARADGGCSPAFTGALGTALAGLPARPLTTGDLPLRTSPHPRHLPPDDRPKIISHTPVEDLVVIPPFEFVEIPPAVIREYFHDEVIARGCPRCDGPFDQIFFYADGLTLPALDGLADRGNGKCQRCGRKSTVWGPEALADF